MEKLSLWKRWYIRHRMPNHLREFMMWCGVAGWIVLLYIIGTSL